VLEPGCGDGAIAARAARRLGNEGKIIGVELDADEARKAQEAVGSKGSVFTGDVFSWFLKTRPDSEFDAVVGNPPFIRYQSFPEPHREKAFSIMRDEGLKPNRLTNAWVPFVVIATRALRPGGRLALVLPAELMQVSYSAELRQYLARKYSRLSLVTFRQLVFDRIQQETVFGLA
jgi:adenine-specific DNA methylase